MMFKKHKKTWILISLIVLIIFILFFALKKANKIIDNINTIESESIQEQYPKTIDFLNSIGRNASIDMYEYSDSKSFDDTLIYYYFMYQTKDEKNFIKVEQELINYLSKGDISEELINKVNYIYYYANVINKYGLTYNKQIKLSIDKAKEIILKEEANIVLLNALWKLEDSEHLLYKKEPKNLTSYIRKIRLDDEDNLSKISYEIIKALSSGDRDAITKAFNNAKNNYSNKEIDFESFLIYLNMFPDEYIKMLSRETVDMIDESCSEMFYDMSSYTTFIAFKIVDKYDSSYLSDIQKIYKNLPVSLEGYLPSRATLIPTYERLYQYSEMCHLLGIEILQVDLEQVVSKMSGELNPSDYYYISLLNRQYKDITIDKSKLELVIKSAEKNKVSFSTLLSNYYLLKAGIINGLDIKELQKNMDDFFMKNSDKYLLADIWKSDIDNILSDKKIVEDKFADKVLKYDGEEAITTYYYYILYLKNASLKCNEEIKEKILNETKKYYVETDQFAGFWQNKEFKYISISNMYKCLFLINYLQEK